LRLTFRLGVQVGHFLTSSPVPLPIEILMYKFNSNAK
jgi:hypothetical protein